MASETNEWLNPLLENLVQAAYGPQGHALPAHEAEGHTRLGYTHEDLDQLLDLFIAFAQQETEADGPDAADAVVHVGEEIMQALDEAATAERTLLSNPASSRWDEALLHWDAAAQALARFYTSAEQHRRAPLANAAGALAFWIETVGKVYCILRLSLDPWADLTGHSGEIVLRRLDQIESRLLTYWHHNRYQFYSILGRRYSRWALFARQRGWAAEADALDFLVSRTRMRTLIAYLRSGRRRFAAPLLTGDTPVPPRTQSLWAELGDRLNVLGRLSIDLFYYATARFGYRPARLVWLNTLIIFVFGLLYWSGPYLNLDGRLPLRGFLQAEYFSALAFMLAALGEITPVGTVGQLLIVLESTWGFLMISVVIATVVNRDTSTPG